MNRRRLILLSGLTLCAVAAAAGLLLHPAEPPAVRDAARIPRPPAISPDYAGLVIPPNIAPLNFVVKEPGTAFRVRIRAEQGEPIEIASRRPEIVVPQQKWRTLLKGSAGRDLRVEVFAQDPAGGWNAFEPIVNTVAREPIDTFLLYRRMDPVFRCWGEITIQQRDLTGFDDVPIVSNRSFSYDCVNCHTVSRPHPERMALQVRSESAGARMLISRREGASAVSTATDSNRSPASYLAWHPNGRLVAFAAIKVTQFFHTVGETRDVFDTASDLGLYDVESNTVTTTAAIARPDRLETYPNWSPDGKYLYFCSAPQLPIDRYREVLYDLARIPYDPDHGTWGPPETVVATKDLHGSVTHPRVSPDGRFVMFCRCDYGNFSIYHPESDLYLLEVASGKYRRLELNSPAADSYHSWSGNSRWMIFSSKRRDGLLTHPYISYIDEAGHARKPFILPQRDPTFYDSSLKIFNVPELTAASAAPHAAGLLQAITDPAKRLSATLDPRVATRPASTAPADPAWHPVQ
jgi:hypothetical protein